MDVVLVDALLPGLGLEEDYASILSDIMDGGDGDEEENFFLQRPKHFKC